MAFSCVSMATMIDMGPGYVGGTCGRVLFQLEQADRRLWKWAIRIGTSGIAGKGQSPVEVVGTCRSGLVK